MKRIIVASAASPTVNNDDDDDDDNGDDDDDEDCEEDGNHPRHHSYRRDTLCALTAIIVASLWSRAPRLGVMMMMMTPFPREGVGG